MTTKARLPRWLAIVAFCTATLALVAAFELAAFLYMKDKPYFDSWDYVTQEHPEVGFVLRKEVSSGWSGVPIRIDRSGLRSQSTDSEVRARREGEYLILCVGNSNTFGNSVAFEATYASRLEALLSSDSRSSIRVVNLGVPGHDSRQSVDWLKSWLWLDPDAVVFSDSFNNRVHWHDQGYDRSWELAGHPVYLAVVLRHRKADHRLPAVPLTEATPNARIGAAAYGEILRELIAMSQASEFRLILLAAGDRTDLESWSREALRTEQADRWNELMAHLDDLPPTSRNNFLPWHFRYRTLRELGQVGRAEALLETYGDSEGAGSSYLRRAVHFSEDYIGVMKAVASQRDIEFLDMRPIFEHHQVRFADVTHYRTDGHELVAAGLARLLRDEVESRPQR